jgi:hypothetical protein
VWLVQGTVTGGPESELLQYGALGVVAFLCLIAVRVLFARVTATADLERARADRLEDELRKLNADIQERYLTTLSEATRAISAALAEQHRDVKR